MQELFKTTLNFILPPRCPVTGEVVDTVGMISPEAWGQLNFIDEPFCTKCGVPFDFLYEGSGGEDQICESCTKNPPAFNKARSVMVYDDQSRGLFLGFKHGDQTHMTPAFIPWLERAGKDMLEKADFLIPVPLHRWRLLKRRYNQAAIIAQYLSKETSVPVLIEGLVRLRATASQGHLNINERAKNVRQAFAVPQKLSPQLKGKNIVLIDDVYTTGATVNECVKTLLDAEAAEVNVLTLARVAKQ